MNFLPGITPHPILQKLGPGFSALALVPPVACLSASSSSSDLVFGDSELSGNYRYHPRKVRVTAAGNLVFQLVGDTADTTLVVAAGEEVLGWFSKIDTTSMSDSFLIFW